MSPQLHRKSMRGRAPWMREDGDAFRRDDLIVFDDEFYEGARCAELVKNNLAEPSWWYAEAGSFDGLKPGQRRAIRQCFQCPVRQECLSHSLFWPEFSGIWGGSLETHRNTARTAERREKLNAKEAVELLDDLATDAAQKRGLCDRRSA